MHSGVCEFITVSVLSPGFVKNNPHLEEVCGAGFPRPVRATLKRSREAERGAARSKKKDIEGPRNEGKRERMK